MTWANLGLFYLYHNDIELANEAFYKAQVLNPDYTPAWIGQGLVAASHKDHKEEYALFAHAITLPATVVSLGTFVDVSLLTCFSRMPTLPSPNDCSTGSTPAPTMKFHQKPLRLLSSYWIGFVDDSHMMRTLSICSASSVKG